MHRFFFQAVERERKRFAGTIDRSKREEDLEKQNEIISEGLKDGLNYIQIATEISDYDVLKYTQVYRSILLGDALIVYSRKLDERNRSETAKTRMELMKLEMLGKMITGEDLKLLEKYEESMNKETGKSKKNNDALLIKSGFDLI